ncbi:MAG: nucleotidyltransferase family protein [Paludibacteraceae bacterium]|nr:nucleotidyltransferase family protein [Paludibacteraceae bacterium]MBP5481554.1 nucleotidyltransferase family protein [Paludibacteraceae bacterium]
MENHLISTSKTLLDALNQINNLKCGPLVLFVVDESGKMVGTLTDGDSRRALISGASVNDTTEKIMHRNFNYLPVHAIGDVQEIRRQKDLQMKLVPVLDGDMHIVDVIDLQKYKTRLPIDAVLMAGGKGERLRPLTEKTPKPLLMVGDKAIIDHNVDRLVTYGIKHISVTVNYLKEQIEEHYATPRNGIKVNCCREPKYLGTIGSVKFVERFYNDTVLVMNSDLFTNIDYEDFFLHFYENEAEMSVAAVPYNVSIPYGILDLEGRNIKGLMEKPQYNYYANAGIYLVKRRVLDEIPENQVFNATDLIEKLISEKKKVIRYPLNGTWIDIGNPQEYQKANDLVRHW